MYDELIRQMMACCKGVPCEDANCGFNPKSHLDCIEQLLTRAADAIEELKKQLDNVEIENIKLKEEFAKYRAKHRWIPVTERLPEPRQDVLAAWDNGEVWTVYQWWAEPKEGEDPLEYDDDIFYENGEFNSTKKRVTHWMPLPEPPKEE